MSDSPGLIDYLTTAVVVLEAGSVIAPMNAAAEALPDTSVQAARGARLSERSPALRERREDIPLLLAHYLKRAANEIAVEPKTLKPEVARYLETLDWPGNVRQLENACRWLTVMASGNEIHLGDLPLELRSPGGDAGVVMDDWEASLRRWAEHRLGRGGGALLDDAIPRFETILIKCALGRTGGRRQEAAKLLGWGRNTLTRKIKELALNV